MADWPIGTCVHVVVEELWDEREGWDFAFKTRLELYQASNARLQMKNGGGVLTWSGRSNQRRVM